jgi:guanylate kinase
VQGGVQVRERFPDAVLIFIEPPTREDQEARLRSRGENEATIARRLAKAAAEEEIGHRIADHVVVNDDLERAIDEVAGIVHRSRTAAAAPSRPPGPGVGHGPDQTSEG